MKRFVLLFLLFFALTACATDSPAAPRIRAEWNFDAAGDFEGWRPNADLAEVVVTNGLLVCRAVGADPILELASPFALPASPWQYLEVRLRASHDGTAEWFWSNTAQGRYGGFSQEKSSRFQIRGDGTWHTWRVYPFWHPEREIVRLRFDLFDGAEFAVDAIRVGELDQPTPAAAPEFAFTGSAERWQAVGECSAEPSPTGLVVRRTGADGFVLGPPVRLDAERNRFLSVRLSSPGGRYATLRFATDASPGLHRFAFPLTASVGEVTYHCDLLAAREWTGTVIALGLQPTDEPGTTTVLRSLDVTETPQGPPQLEVKSLGPEEAVPRAGRPTWLQAVVANTGAAVATNLSVAVALTRDGRAWTNLVLLEPGPRLSPGDERHFRWSFQADAAGPAQATLRVTAANAATVEAATTLSFAPSLNLEPSSYVPEPVPVRGPYEVGVYYFPGWKSAGQWEPIRGVPERRPMLGWYQEGNPEVADWHIKWAVEHGITFFAYDWYWSQGARQLEHALHDGFFHARYRHLLKFCLLWANHNAPGTHSPADCVEVTRYWIANYFGRPEHLQIEGKPVMIIFSPQRLTEDLGGDGVRRAFEAMRAECRQAGLGGLYLLACIGSVGEARRAFEEGYDAVTAYTWPGLGMSGDGLFAPFATILEGYRRQWEQLRDQGGLPLMTPVCGGWDSRPWHGLNNLVRYDRTPALFQQHLEDARRFIQGVEVRSPKSEDRGEAGDTAYRGSAAPWQAPAAAVAAASPADPALHEPGRGRPRPRYLRFKVAEQVRKDQAALHEATVSGGARLLPSHPDEDRDVARRRPRPTGYMASTQGLGPKGTFPRPVAPATPLPLVLIEAWNEWGEGAYIEPQQEFGFGYLEAIRTVFTEAPHEHLDVTPADVGRGPYDVAAPPPSRTTWSFAEGNQGWAAGMHLTEARAVQGALEARTTGTDPAFFSPPLEVAASDDGVIELRMRLTPRDGRATEDQAQVFWRTRQLPESEATSIRFPVHPDGLWHEYRVPVAANPRWRGIVTRLRLDPCSRAEVTVSLDRLRLVPATGDSTGP